MRILVKIEDDYIQLIHAEDLRNVEKDEYLEISTHEECYKLNNSAIITIDDDSVEFVHWGNIIDLDYKDIEHIYLIKPKERDFLILIPMIIMFILGILIGILYMMLV